MSLSPTLQQVKDVSKEFPRRKGKTIEIIYSIFDTQTHEAVNRQLYVFIPENYMPVLKKRGNNASEIAREFAERTITNWIKDEKPFEKEVTITSEFYQAEVHNREESVGAPPERVKVWKNGK